MVSSPEGTVSDFDRGKIPENAISPRVKTGVSDEEPHKRHLEITVILGSNLILETMDFSTLAKLAKKEGDHEPRGTILVTGSRGQDGSYLRDLLGHDQTIGCVNPRSRAGSSLASNEVSIDLGDKDAVTELLRAARPTTVFHLAARHGPSAKMTYEAEDVEMMKRLHVDATKNFLEAIDSLGLDTHFVVAGSSRIFSPNERTTRISEDSQPNPVDFYGDSKLKAWEIVKTFRADVGSKASFLVLFNHESPRRPPGYLSQDLAASVLRTLSRRESEITVRDAGFLGDWSDARDVVELMAAVGHSQSSEDLVVGSGSLRSVGSIVEGVLSLLGKQPLRINSLINQDEPNTRNSLVASNSKSIELGFWNPRISIERTVAEIINHLRHV